MGCFRQFSTLLWKNWLLKKRNLLGSICEIILPLIFALVMIGLYSAFDENNFPDLQFIKPLDVKTVYPLHASIYRTQFQNEHFAMVADSLDGSITVSDLEAISADFDSWYPAFNGSTVGGSGFTNPTLRNLYIPSFSSRVKYFSSNQELEDYVTSEDYGVGDNHKIWGGYTIRSLGANASYGIRMNASEVPTTLFAAVDLLTREVEFEYIEKYQLSTSVAMFASFARDDDRDPIFDYPRPGFLSLQLAMDRYLINRPYPISSISPEKILELFQISLAFMIPNSGVFMQEMMTMAINDPLRYEAIVNDLTQYIGEPERYAPQQVEFLAFPTAAFTSNNFYTNVLMVLSFFFVITYLYPVSRLIRALVAEKETKLREGMKMMGLSDSANIGSWMVTYVIIYFIIAILIMLVTSGNIFSASNKGLIFLFFFLFGISTATYCWLVSVFFSRAKTAATLGMALYFGSFFPFFGLQSAEQSMGAKLGGSIFSCTAFALGIDVIGAFESSGVGASMKNINFELNNWQLSLSFGMLVFDTVLYAFLAWYLDQTLPSSFREYGVSRPWYFLFTRSYWREIFGLPFARSADPITSSPVDNEFIEPADPTLRAKAAAGKTVHIVGLRKEFPTPDGTKVAVDSIEMTMYEDQIFVLLGHNGAGKTTTISMMTGLIPASAGSVKVYGLDGLRPSPDLRREIGVCPQHDVLWPELTVEEHLRIFSAIKGVDKAKVDASIDRAIAEVGLTEKKKYKSSSLSGGQKRKLSICIALVGDSRVIFLDEPTSGMDPYSRRSTWNILRSAREGRVIVLTTHFMDEADILGDRIAIMANGKVKCDGSPLFLKKKFGVGYVLTVVKDSSNPADSARILEVVLRHVPGASVSTDVGAELVIRMPLDASPQFPALLREIDDNKESLSVTTYGISVSDIQDVFFKVAEGDHPSHHAVSGNNVPYIENPINNVQTKDAKEDRVKNYGSITPTSPTPNVDVVGDKLSQVRAQARKIEGSNWQIFWRHFFALLMKRIQITKRDVRSLCYQLLIPVLVTVGGLALLTAGDPLALPSYHMTTAQFNVPGSWESLGYEPRYPNYVPFYNFKSGQADLTPGADGNPGVYDLLSAIPTVNATMGEAQTISPLTIVELDETNPYNFIDTSGNTSSPASDWQRMNTFLLRDRTSYAASKYGAYMLTSEGTILTDQALETDVFPNTNAMTYSVFQNTSARHAGPVFMNVMNSALRQKSDPSFTADGKNDGFINVYSYPLPWTKKQASLFGAFFSFSCAIIILVGYSFIPASYAIYIVKEREVNAKHQQMISGVSIPAYWFSTFIFDSVTYIVPAVLSIVACYLFDIVEFTATKNQRLAACILLFWFYGLSVGPFTYLLTFLFKSHSTAQNVVLLINVTCMILMIASFVMGNIESTCRVDAGLRYIFRLFPGYAFGNGLLSLAFLDNLAVLEASCDYAHGIQRDPSSIKTYQALDFKASGLNILYMFISGFVYFGLTLLVEYFLSVPRWRQRIFKDPVVEMQPVEEDEDVIQERQRVKMQLEFLRGSNPLVTVNEISSPDGVMVRNVVHSQSPLPSSKNKVSPNASPVDVEMSLEPDVILLDDLRKVYPGPLGVPKTAVRNLSFGIPAGQIFGFLGINGAGKTTTLSMLSGDVLPSSGTALLAGFDIIDEQPQVRRLLGYCPQWDALLELLTVREHLEFYARIKGIPAASVNQTVRDQINMFDLGDFENKTAGSLSGGNKRKLSVAIALMGNPPIVFLDEPATGMDVIAKRFMWKVLSNVATERKLCSIVLTTHSMEEVEALCSRIGIMVGGRLRCLGSSQHLKMRYGQGYMVEVRLKEVEDAAVAAISNTHAVVLNRLSFAPPSLFTTDLLNRRVSRASWKSLCEDLGRPERFQELTEDGTGWTVVQADEKSALLVDEYGVHRQTTESSSQGVFVKEFMKWWLEEDLASSLIDFVVNSKFKGATLRERHGPTMRFAIPPQQANLASIFESFENARVPYSIQNYSLSQTSLEQIFNHFASQQDEETGAVRGMIQN